MPETLQSGANNVSVVGAEETSFLHPTAGPCRRWKIPPKSEWTVDERGNESMGFISTDPEKALEIIEVNMDEGFVYYKEI